MTTREELTDNEESIVRLRLERPGRYREEEGEGDEAQLIVRDGQRWWSYNSFFGAQTNEGEPDSMRSSVYGQYEALLTPAQLLGQVQFEQLGSGERAGRRVITARGRPDPDQTAISGRALSAFGQGADEIQVEVDAERGVILAAASWFMGEPLSSIAAFQVAFDEQMPPDAFVFASPDGAVPVSELEHGPEQVSIHEAAQLATFPVFVITGMPEPWALFATFVPARERPPRQAEVMLMYLAPDGAGTIMVRQCPAAGAGEPRVERPAERTVEHDGVPVDVLGHIGGFNTVRTSRDGTQIEITSADLAEDRLIELAVRLAPARQEPSSI